MNIKGITKRGENTYRFTISQGFDGRGKHIRKTKTYKVPEGTPPTKAEKLVIEAFATFQKQHKISQEFCKSKITAQFMCRYFFSV